MTVEDLIRKHEGCEASPYPDQNGIMTCGIGHNLAAWPLPGEVYPMTQERIDAVFAKDLERATNDLVSNFPWYSSLDPVRQAVLVDMSFQLGITKLTAFKTFLGLVEAGNYQGAAADLMQTDLARETPIRASENADMLSSGLWPDTAEEECV